MTASSKLRGQWVNRHEKRSDFHTPFIAEPWRHGPSECGSAPRLANQLRAAQLLDANSSRFDWTARDRITLHPEDQMRKLLLVAVVVTACAKAEAPKADTTSAMAAPAAAPAPAPARLTAADLAGTWNGESKPEGKDSVVERWTVVNTTDSTGTLTNAKSKQKIPYSIRFDGDSMIATSQPFVDQTMKGPKQVFRAVGRMKDGTLSGHSTAMLASKPDSVLGRITWTATKAP